jgi:hypothetical protein
MREILGKDSSSFLQSGLPHKAYAQFTKADLEERGVLYRQIAERLWGPNRLLRELAI